jgi:hypothetical protein
MPRTSALRPSYAGPGDQPTIYTLVSADQNNGDLLHVTRSAFHEYEDTASSSAGGAMATTGGRDRNDLPGSGRCNIGPAKRCAGMRRIVVTALNVLSSLGSLGMLWLGSRSVSVGLLGIAYNDYTAVTVGLVLVATFLIVPPVCMVA